jgi:acetate kinase
MKILVANLGSTSFKYRLFDLSDGAEHLLARGAVERIGGTDAKVRTQTDRGTHERSLTVADHGDAMQLCLDELTHPDRGVMASVGEVAAIGFKAVHSRNFHGVHRVNNLVLDAMDVYSDVAPAHNPPYVKAMRNLAQRFPTIPLVAAFETDFHASIPERNARYAIPEEWTALGVRRWGFHGASHRFVSWRMAQLLGRTDLKLISCHLGGSSSLCAINSGRSVASSMGMSPQTGIPHNNRVGDFDVFALPAIIRETGLSLDAVLEILANKSGLEALCGLRDLRDIEAAAGSGDSRATQALAIFVAAIRHYLGAYLVELGGADAIVFTGGIGENSSRVRSLVMRDLQWFGLGLDTTKNEQAQGECLVSSETSRAQIWALPANEEIVIARQVKEHMLS